MAPLNINTKRVIGTAITESHVAAYSASALARLILDCGYHFVRWNHRWENLARERSVIGALVSAGLAVIRCNDYNSEPLSNPWIWRTAWGASIKDELTAAYAADGEMATHNAAMVATGVGKAIWEPSVMAGFFANYQEDATRLAAYKNHVYIEFGDGGENPMGMVYGNTLWNGLWATPSAVLNLGQQGPLKPDGSPDYTPGRRIMEEILGHSLPPDAVMVYNTIEANKQAIAISGMQAAGTPSYHVYWNWSSWEPIPKAHLGWVPSGYADSPKSMKFVDEYNVPWSEPEKYPNPAQMLFDGAMDLKSRGASRLCFWWGFGTPGGQDDYNAMCLVPERVAAVKKVKASW